MAYKPITLSTSLTLDERHVGTSLVMSNAGVASTYTLPAATGSGNYFEFVVGAVNTSNYIINVTGNDTMDGSVLSNQDGADTIVGFSTAADSDTITLNGTTTGGVSIGDWIKVWDVAADQWAVSGIITGSGTEATPFSAAVS